MSRLASKARTVKLARLVSCVVLIGLLAACDLQSSDGTLPDITLPDISVPDATTPEETLPEATTPEATTPEEGEGGEESEVPPWLWIVLAAVVVALAAAALTRRSKEHSVTASWTERARSALSGMASIEATLGRPATLDPADHEAARRSVANARDQSVTFEQLATSAPDPTVAQHAAATADALRVLATSSEIEIEGLASGALSTVVSREAAESERLALVHTLHQAADRLSQSLR